MKNAQTFSNKVFELALLSDYERIASSFNRQLHSFYLKERNVFRQFRTLRQARIRLDMAVRTYEVAPRQSAYVVKLLKAEEELLGMIVSGKQHPDLYTEGESSLRWSGNLSDLAELIYGLHAASCINDGRCDIKEIAEGFERLFNVRLPHIYNRFIAIRNRKNERAVFLRKLYDTLTCKLDELDR